jgi:hypothetical protein
VRVNIYAEELTDRVELVTKEIRGTTYTAVRFYLELPVTIRDCDCEEPSSDCPTQNISGPFMHRPGDDDDSAAVTFWGKKDLKNLLQKALNLLEEKGA